MSRSLREMLKVDWKSTRDIGYQKPTESSKKIAQTSAGTPKAISITNDLSTKLKTKVVIPDIHSFERDSNAYELCMESLKVLADKFDVDEVIQLGDLLECKEFSRHKGANVNEADMSYSEELEWAMNDFWKRVIAANPDAKLTALLGNHEDRVHSAIINDMKQHGNIAKAIHNAISPIDAYSSLGVNVIPYGNENPKDGTYWITPDLFCTHGWSFATNAAKAHLDKTMGAASIIFGHVHRIQSYARRNSMTGRTFGAWSFGALAKTNMFYQKGQPNDHCLGFGIVQTDGNWFNPITIPMLNDGSKDLVVLPDGSTLIIKG